MTFLFRAVLGFLRTLAAVLLYGFALVCLFYGLVLALVVQDSFSRNAATGDLTGATMGQAIILGWLAPLAIGAVLLAMLLRWPARAQPVDGFLSLDRKWARVLEHAGRGTRTIVVTGLACVSLVLVSLFARWVLTPYANEPPPQSAYLYAVPPYKLAVAPGKPGAQGLVLIGPLLLLAASCALMAWRIARSAAAGEPTGG